MLSFTFYYGLLKKNKIRAHTFGWGIYWLGLFRWLSMKFCCVDNSKYCNNGIWPSKSRNRNILCTNTEQTELQKGRKSASINLFRLFLAFTLTHIHMALHLPATCKSSEAIRLVFVFVMWADRRRQRLCGVNALAYFKIRHKSGTRPKKKYTIIDISFYLKIYSPWANLVLGFVACTLFLCICTRIHANILFSLVGWFVIFFRIFTGCLIYRANLVSTLYFSFRMSCRGKQKRQRMSLRKREPNQVQTKSLSSNIFVHVECIVSAIVKLLFGSVS